MLLKKINRGIIDYLIVYIGCMIQAFAVTAILKPNGLVVGGFTGISLVLGQLINVNYTFIYYTLCVSVLIIAWLILGKKEALKIILLSTTYPIILILFDNLNLNFIDANSNDKLLSCIYYGIFAGIGLGLVLKNGFSQGSSDTVAKIIHKKFFPFISVSQILLVIDICILTLSGFVFGRNAVLYAIIMQMIYVKTVDTVLFGFGSSLVKMVIVSTKTTEISDYILNKINKGVSIGNITGAHSNKSKTKIISVCSARESMLIKNFVAKMDNDAFINVVPVISAWGKGYGLDNLEID
ncbi:YitT family protein [Clostridium aestuarii]|uniref:YitT family protein n=1 Tax=Clostridium aestuarii TaxID=338193 RepID=A0ABT4CX20_9CLOT|nr:YitT family protein [Clostridium aestuarii]MCY6483387.1 YitT family protein [Clostridium aestuarii]